MSPVTVVTGGSRGIGAAQEVAGAVRDAGARAVVVRVDTSVEADVERLFEVAEEQLGAVTGLVNNAGVTGPLGRLADADPVDLRRVVDVNFLGVLLCSRRAAQLMAPRGAGSIVNISSAAATLGSPGDYVHYAASKAAVDALTVGLSKELGADGIRVNAVAPGMIDTEMHAAMGDPDRAHRAASAIPLGRPGRAEEIAGAVAWLLSREAAYTTGAVLRVAGGR
ncbi:SDR family oxidoreductase [Streptomyces acidiscabies]|uniref:Oxidoreductase n=1 Tax=Streptomyces acidiscabies TaxID=42234 RepID=A0A0L0KD50_9ACTN|nr:SDR family oxidoreductase [Streptomyces acidiscabies]KND36057.1 oxidoreductase [Streptomyces acidiscabies]